MFTWIRLYDGEIVGNMSVLTVSDAGATNGGVYRCDVVNNAGNDSDTVTLNGEKFICTCTSAWWVGHAHQFSECVLV